MIRAVTIVPTILTTNKQDYLKQASTINTFSKRVQIDISDGVFAPTKTLGITEVQWPKDWMADLHLMVARPSEYLNEVTRLHPSLCIFHAETGENLLPIFDTLKKAGIKTGVALLPSTYPGDAKQYIDAADHVLIFAGKLGVQGSRADLMQVEKAALIREMKPSVEIGWDGGANMSNVRALAHDEIDIINVGSAISNAPQPAAMFQELVAEIDKDGVVL